MKDLARVLNCHQVMISTVTGMCKLERCIWQ